MGTIKVLAVGTDSNEKREFKGIRVAKVFFSIMLLMGGLLVAGATADLVSAGKYILLFGPGELAQSVSWLGDLADTRMALESALAREYGTKNIAQVIQLLSERYDSPHPLEIPNLKLYIDTPIDCHNPLDGVVAAGQTKRCQFY